MGKLLVLLLASQLFMSSLYADNRKSSDVNNKDFSNQTALHDAVRTKKIDMVKFLVENKTKMDTKDQFGYTPLHLAVRYSDLETSKYLISKKANLNSVDQYGETPLIDAVRNNNTEISKALICAKANRNVVDQYDVSAVHYATKNENLYLLKLLTVDYVELYCQNSIEISIEEDKAVGAQINKVCGKLDSGYASFMSLVLVGDDKNEYGPYKVDIDNKNHTWCSKVDDGLPMGRYRVTAKANDYVVNYATAKADRFISSAIKIQINKSSEPIYSYSPKVCGTIQNAYAKDINVTVSPEDDNKTIFGPFSANIENENKKWCADVKVKLKKGSYIFSANGIDMSGNTSIDSTLLSLESPISIDITPVPIYNDNTPKICGKTIRGESERIELFLKSKDGEKSDTYEAKINKEQKTWCVDIQDEIENGKYEITAKAYDKDNNEAIDIETTKVYRIIGLYEALNDEFKNDYSKWSAELDKDTLTFRFKDPSLLFITGSSYINGKFKTILTDFFPRYVKIVEAYKAEINKVRIEGHSSSEHALAKSDEERFELNRRLSQKRAESVMNNAKAIKNEILTQKSKWVDDTFEAVGMSYSRLVLNLDGSENKELSRRVEFRIETKTIGDTPMIDGDKPLEQ